MIKKIVKLVLLVMMVVGALVIVSNLADTQLKSEGFKVVTYFENVPDCYGPPSDCNDFTLYPLPQ